jgi:hypothetical protein
LGVVNNLRPDASGGISVRLLPLAWTPLGIVVGEGRQDVAIKLDKLFDWVDRTFPVADDHAFIASLRDLELLVRVGWESPFPEPLDERNLLNLDEVPDEIADALAQPVKALVQCAACRRLCVRDDFVWKEKQLCAWDFHVQVFGKRGPWRDGPYEDRHFETLASCAYLAPDLLKEPSVRIELMVDISEIETARVIVNTLLSSEPGVPHMAVQTADGIAVLREG